MYSYEWDVSTGGILLNTTPLAFSKEPRPVYYEELDILGFDQFWNYEKNNTYPYMWAESNNYYYRGRLVAKTKGGAIYSKPEIIIVDEPEKNDAPLRFIDVPAMVEKNRDIIESLSQETIKAIYNTYINYSSKIDVFYVAFSGGKDSIVTLDLVQRALPHNSFKVLFGDTHMEFSDTYETVDEIRVRCANKGIEFIVAEAEQEPEETWNKFGPPSTVTRWCCSVHKTAPQILALRNVIGKNDFTGMGFVGVRADESVARSKYSFVSYGEKHKGQYSCNAILEWNSAEVFLYIYMNDLVMNKAYLKGNRRAGCLICPRAAERNDFMNHFCYYNEAEKYVEIIKKLYRSNFKTEEALNDFVNVGGWKARKNGRDLALESNYEERKTKEEIILSVTKPRNDWKEWIKTMGVLLTDNSPYILQFQNNKYQFQINEIKTGYEVHFDVSLAKENPKFVKHIKNVFRKAASCIGCRECEADCHNGCIQFVEGKVRISDACVHCMQCHKVEKGCLVYKSLEKPKGGGKMATKNMSLNCYSHHAPKMDWFEQYFRYKNEFHENHNLGSQMYNFFKRFLRDANLLDDEGFSQTANVIDKISLDSEAAWGIMLCNLCYTPQIGWYVKNVSLGEQCSREYLVESLIADGAKESWAPDIWSSLVRILDLPFGNVGLGFVTREKNRAVALTRKEWVNPDPLVVLYSLYKFAEACGDYYQFTLSRLMNLDIDSQGVSPAQIFGFDREQMERILNGLSVNYPEFISVSFSLDLDNITLRNDKTAMDVLTLF